MVSFSFSGIELHVLDIVAVPLSTTSVVVFSYTLYFLYGKDNLISNVNVNILCLVHKPVCRSTVLWQYFATWQTCLFYLACVVSFFCEWLLLYLIATFGNLIQYHLKHWFLDIKISTVLGRIDINKWITKIESRVISNRTVVNRTEVTCH